MDWSESIENAIGYIEENLGNRIDYTEVAKRAFSSSYHFQRVFGILCGLTLGEYIRRRRLSRAAGDLLAGEKVLRTALKYGYDSSESFSRAFFRFHGVLPSQVKRGCPVKIFPRLSPNFGKGEIRLDCTIQERPAKILTGYKKRFSGVPFGRERLEQERAFYSSTRGKQWLLLGAASDYATEYSVITNIGDDGYDFHIAFELDEWTRNALFDPSITGMNLDKMHFQTLSLPKRICAVFPTEKSKRPTLEYMDIRQRIVTEWLPMSDYQFAEGPEVTEVHWRTDRDNGYKNRFIEITLPVERKKRALS